MDVWEGDVGSVQGCSLLISFKTGMNHKTIVEGIEYYFMIPKDG